MGFWSQLYSPSGDLPDPGMEPTSPVAPALQVDSYFLVSLGLHCCPWAFSSCSEQGLLLVAVHGLLIEVASLVAEYRL